LPGLFLTFEGVEGSGKSSRCRDLLEALRQRRCETVFTREPGGPDISERIRELLLDPGLTVPPVTELMLYFAGRAANVDLVVRPGLGRGAVVLCDRYGDATMAYQGYGRGLPLDGIRTANRLATGGLEPHLTVLMDLDPGEGFRRMSSSGRKLDRIEMEDLAFHRRVREGYLELAAGEPERFLVVDGMLAPGEQNALILGEVIRRGEERKVAGL
jgi:dTMP kinase